MVQDGAPVHVMLFGTHPKQFNGYSKVVYELAKELSLHPDRLTLSIFGFQNFHAHAAHRLDLPDNVDIYDAWANENPKQMGFGVAQAADVVKLKRPDIVVIYNDLMIITQVLGQLKDIPNKWFKIVLYIDQVYLSQRRDFINFINAHADAAFAFTPSWRTCILDQGLTLPCDILEHGISPQKYYPIPKSLARRYFNLNDQDFLVLNLNRNQPRKRWDTCLKAFAQVIANERNRSPPIKFIIGTALQGAWDLLEIFQRELGKRNITLQEGLQHLIIIENPQMLTDQEINVLYNASDCGINTADGEGVGLCSVEPGVIGIPQIVPRVGGFLDFFDDDSAIMVDPKIAYYVDASRDMVGGEAQLCDYCDYVDAIEMYYADPGLRKVHGEASRKKILRPHLWSTIAEHFIDVIEKVHSGEFCKGAPPAPPVPAPPAQSVPAPQAPVPVPAPPAPAPQAEKDPYAFDDFPAPSQPPALGVEPSADPSSDSSTSKDDAASSAALDEIMKIKAQLESMLAKLGR